MGGGGKDSTLGSGQIILNGGTLRTVNTKEYSDGFYRRISNDIVVNADSILSSTADTEMFLYGNISGTGNLTENVTFSLRLYGDNSAYAGNWTLNGDWTWSLNEWGTKQDSWVGSGDYSFGSGAITLNGGGIAFADANKDYHVWNDLVVAADHTTFMKGGKSVTLSGKLSGAKAIRLQTVGTTSTTTSTPVVHLRGDNTGFSGDWYIGSGKTVTTDSGTSTGTDARFGSGTIYLEGGTIQSARSNNRAYVLNNIVVNADSNLKAVTHELSLNGNISGTGDLAVNGSSFTLYLHGDNSNFEGDWYIWINYVCVNNDGTQTPTGAGDYTFGQGTVYLGNNTGLRTANQGGTAYVGADIAVASGTAANLRYGNFTMGGTVTIDGTLNGNNGQTSITDGVPSMKVAGTLQGNGTVAVPLTFAENAILSAGTVGSVGKLAFNQTVDLSHARIQVDIGPDGVVDQLVFNGETTLAESMLLDVNLLDGASLVGGKSYDVLEFTGDLLIPLDFDWNAILSPQTAYLFNTHFADNVLSLTVDGAAVPEPGSCVLLVLGLVGGFLVLRKKRLAMVLLAATGFGSMSMAQGISVEVGADGVTQNLTQGTPVVCDTLTGAGKLTLTTPAGTRQDAMTYGTFQFGTNATVNGFIGDWHFDKAIVDLNGNSLSVGTITVPTTTTSSTGSTTTTYDDTSSSIGNTSNSAVTLTLTKGGYLHTALNETAGKISLVWEGNVWRNMLSANTHSGGSKFSQGTVALGNTQALGSGDVEFSNINVNFTVAKLYTLSQDVAISGDVRFRMQNGSTLEISGDVSGSGNWAIPYDGGWVKLSGAQKSFTGKIQVGTMTNAWGDAKSKATLQLTAENILNPQSELAMENSYGGSYLELNGFNQQIKAISGQGTIRNSGTSPATITANAAFGTLAIQSGVTLKVAEKGNHALGTSAENGTVDFAGGTLTATQMEVKNLVLRDDTVLEAPHDWGKSVFAGNDISTAIAPSVYQDNMDVEVNTSYGERNDVFPLNTTMSFATYVDVAEETQLSFLKNFDDYGRVWLTPVLADGTLGTKTVLLESDGGTDVGTALNTPGGNWNAIVVNEATLEAGRYLLEVRVGQASGGVGPTAGGKLGIGIKAGGNVASMDDLGQYSALTIANNQIAGIAGLEVISPEVKVSSDIAIADGKTLTFRPGNKGHILSTGTISGAGSKLVLEGASGAVTMLGNNTYDGGTTVGVKELTLGTSNALGTGDVTFNEATTVKLDERANPDFYKAWAEGTVLGSFDTTKVPTETVLKAEPTYMTGRVTATQTMYVYTSQMLTALEDFTLYLGEDFDDNAAYKITNLTTGESQSGVNMVWNESTTDWEYAFQKGHDYQLEVRLYNGAYGGGAGTGLGGDIGFGARLSENGSWQVLNFDENGILMNTPLEVAREKFVINNNLNLNQDVTMDAASASKEVTLGGKITGENGGLTLQNGDFRLTNTENRAKRLSLENTTYQLGRETGVFETSDSLVLRDSKLALNLTRLDVEPLPEDFAWFTTTGEVVLENVELLLDYEGDVPSNLTTLTLVDALEGTNWASLMDEIAVSFLNSQLRGGLSVGLGGDLLLTFGNAASVPEPATWMMLLLGLGGLGIWKRLRNPKILVR